MDSKESLKKMDDETVKLGLEMLHMAKKDIASGGIWPNKKFDVWKYIGFNISGSKVIVPHNPCGHPLISPYSLLPMYDCLLFPVNPYVEQYYGTKTGTVLKAHKITDKNVFQQVHGLTSHEIAYLAERGRIIPCFNHPYAEYDEKIIEPLLQTGVPRLSLGVKRALENLFTGIVRSSKGEDFKKYRDLAKKDLTENFGLLENPAWKDAIDVCGECLASLYAEGLRGVVTACGIRNIEYICVMNELRFSQFLGAVIQTECRETKDIVANWSGLPHGSSFEAIANGLKVNYRNDIPLESYLDILDSKTTAAVRTIVQRLLSDPLASKYSERLSAKVFEFNQQIEELSKSKAAKIFSVVSDIVVYGGSRFVESQSQKMIRMPKKGLQKMAEWIASKGLDVQARLTGKDWAIAQLCKTRCKIEKCTIGGLSQDTKISE